MRHIIATIVLTLITVQTTGAEEARISYPADYRETFTNYLSLDRVQNHDQVIRLFANDVAMKGMEETGEFPNGSILIGEVYKAKKDDKDNVIETSLGRRVRGTFALVAVMEKQEGWGENFEEGFKNGDWDFAAFKPDGSVADKDLNACRACHAPLADEQHVFSVDHLK